MTHIIILLERFRRAAAPLLRWGGGEVVLLVLLFALPSHAVTKANADAEYGRGNFQQAIKDYEELLQAGPDADLYYNLAGAYYRSDNIPRALLNYERALLLQPGNDDIRFNLDFVRQKTIDKITPRSEMFFVTWGRAVVNFTSVDRWAWTSIGALALALCLCLLWLFGPKVWMRGAGFFGGIAAIVVCALAGCFAAVQQQQLQSHTGAIVIAPSVTVKKTPSKTSADQFVLHEGTRVDITDHSMRGWRAIELADGRKGWVSDRAVEEI